MRVNVKDTCFYDKNGKEVCKGDIFKFDDEIWSSSMTECGTEYDSFETHDQYALVGFENGKLDLVRFKLNDSQVNADMHENDELTFAEFVREHEVIGNIYVNPELLEDNE